MLADMRLQMMSMDGSLGKITDDQSIIESWKPEIEGKVTDLQGSVTELKQKVEVVLLQMPKEPAGMLLVANKGASSSAHLEEPPSTEAPGQSRHHQLQDHRSLGVGAVTSPMPTPVKGAIPYPAYTPPHFRSDPPSGRSVSSVSQGLVSALPQVNFPVFDGSSPKMWKKRCETFFEFYDVPREMWVKLAAMQFDGPASFWLQSIESTIHRMSWDDLCCALCNRFGRDQHGALMRQFFHIHQKGSVSECIEQFDTLIHQLLAHDGTLNIALLTTRFIDGLRDDIRAVVLVHRPQVLDTASSLLFCRKMSWRKHPEGSSARMK